MAELTEAEHETSEQLKEDVYALAGEIGERNMHTFGSMEKTCAYIRSKMEKSGYEPVYHKYQLSQGMYSGKTAVNLTAELPGNQLPDQIIVVGSHYDTVPHSPGANDNASAVAVLLALADYFSDRPLSKTVRFTTFANEEPPFFHTKDMGSYVYAARCRYLEEEIVAMIALDGLGYYSNDASSQHYPLPGLNLIYPDKADFISLVSRLRDFSLVQKAGRSFRKANTIQCETAVLPGLLPGVGWSDHWAFWKHGYPACLMTDTLLFRDPEYHSPGDTPDRLNYPNMTRIISGLKHVIRDLAQS